LQALRNIFKQYTNPPPIFNPQEMPGKPEYKNQKVAIGGGATISINNYYCQIYQLYGRLF